MTALLAQTIETTVLESELEAARTYQPAPHLTLIEGGPAAKLNTSLHPGVFKAFAAINASILGVFWWTFRGDGEALFMVAISAVYLAAYLGTPYVMTRIGNADAPQTTPFLKFLNEPFETWTGVITGREALTQVLLIPTAILVATIGMGSIIALAG